MELKFLTDVNLMKLYRHVTEEMRDRKLTPALVRVDLKTTTQLPHKPFDNEYGRMINDPEFISRAQEAMKFIVDLHQIHKID